jgi:putative ATP-binding cassette transporter
VAFARVLVNHPDIIYLDEASSALDEAMEAHLYHVLSERLPQSAIISVGHRSTLDVWHNQQITINRNRELNGSI